MDAIVDRSSSSCGKPDAFHRATRSSQKSFRISYQMLSDLLAVYDIGAIILCGIMARLFYFGVQRRIDTDFLEYLSVILLATISFQFIARQSGLYDPDKIKKFSTQLSLSIYVSGTTFAITLIILFFIKISQHYSRIWVAEWFTLFLLCTSIGRGLFAQHINKLIRNGALRRSLALIGMGPSFERVKEQLRKDEQHFWLTAVHEFPENDAHDADLQAFIDDVRLSGVEEVLIALPAFRAGLLEKIVRQVQILAADVHILPDFGGCKLPFLRVQHAGDLSFITTISKPIEGWGALQKKIEDYALAAIGLILALPVMLLVALAIKLDSPGPVFFRQRRHGYNHRVIEVLKFRTMTVLEDGDIISQAKKNDKRVTRIGWILRRTSLDELPQLLNVLRGDMSIVGPRPHALAHNTYYGDLVENYANRHRVKPGITGWAQVHGYRGETDHPKKMVERVRYDLEYIDNWSIWLDLKIIMLTPLFGLFGRGAF